MIATPSGSAPTSTKTSGPPAFGSMTTHTASTSSGKPRTGPTSGRRWGEKENGPNPTDRAKPGMKDHVLTDGRGVPLSIVVTPANVNDDKRLAEVIDNFVIVRPIPTTKARQHLALDAAFDNAPARGVVFANR